MNKVSLCSNLYANIAAGRVVSRQGQLKLRFHLKTVKRPIHNTHDEMQC